MSTQSTQDVKHLIQLALTYGNSMNNLIDLIKKANETNNIDLLESIVDEILNNKNDSNFKYLKDALNSVDLLVLFKKRKRNLIEKIIKLSFYISLYELCVQNIDVNFVPFTLNSIRVDVDALLLDRIDYYDRKNFIVQKIMDDGWNYVNDFDIVIGKCLSYRDYNLSPYQTVRTPGEKLKFNNDYFDIVN